MLDLKQNIVSNVLMASVYVAGKPIPEFQADSEATLWK